MTGKISMFSHLKNKDGGHFTYGDNRKGKVVGVVGECDVVLPLPKFIIFYL